MAWTKAGSVYHYATEVEVLKEVLKNQKGREDSLASNEAYQAIVAKAGKDAQAVWYPRHRRRRSTWSVTVLKSQDQGNAMVIENQLKLTGLDALKAVGGGLAFNVGPYDQLGKVFLYAPGESQGLAAPVPDAAGRPDPRALGADLRLELPVRQLGPRRRL